MTDLVTLTQNIADLRDTMQQERSAIQVEREGMLDVVRALREGVDALEARINAVFQDREAVVTSLMGGNGSPVALAT